MRNNIFPGKKSPPKLIFLPPELDYERQFPKAFRRSKKTLKTLHINTTPRFVDQAHIRSQFKEWLGKMNDSRQLRETERTNTQKGNTLDLSTDRIYQLYHGLRDDEKVVKPPPSDSLRSIALKQTSIRVNLREVQKMKTGIEQKIALSPKEFHTEFTERPQTTLGPRPLQSREKPQSRRNLMGSSLHTKKRCMTERRELLPANVLEKFLEHSPTTPLSTSKAENLYAHRSRNKKIWETIGLYEWRNIS